MVRFQGQAKVSMAMLPHRTDADLSDFVVQNFIDEAVQEHWQKLGVIPADLCSDEVFHSASVSGFDRYAARSKESLKRSLHPTSLTNGSSLSTNCLV